MHCNQYVSVCLVALVLGQAAALPQQPQYPQQQLQQQAREDRKFAEKPNAMKKVALDDLDDVSTNQIQEGGSTGFSWSNMLSMLMQMLLGQTGGVVGPSKNEIDEGAPPSPWANLLSVGLRLLTALLGGPQQQTDGIDKVDNQSSTMQDILAAMLSAFLRGRHPNHISDMAKNASEFINIVVNLLDALKTSFSHRSLTARSIGRRDTISEAAVASITMLKGYVRSLKTINNIGRAEDEGQRGCAERALCEASAECVAKAQGTSSIFCQFGSYATSYLIQRQSGVGFDALFEASRRGRSGEDCRTLFMDCNAV
ncbi:uncharacterized protein LOC143369672 [Andrena cerasifolii]|uniref:uncharacterized protein LOC143369672 n=1 Tax=Andrena cerasifolii TaxID=2819439 RepID=UPI0040382FCE